MNKIIETIRGLQNYSRVGNVSDVTITDAEIQLRLRFAKDYREYLAEFGAISAFGMELTGIISVDYRDVVSATKQEWEFNPEIPHTMYVIENTYVDDVIIWQDTNGLIYQSTPYAKPKQIAASLSEYILSRTK